VWRDREAEKCFPRLAKGDYNLTSPKDKTYNCVAWAVGDKTHFWYDLKIKGYYWPPGARSADTLDGWKDVFEIHNYSDSNSDDYDPELEKIAIYIGSDGAPNHVARQTASGTWSSKLGKGCDIEHDTLDVLEGEEYGTVGVIMQRPCKDGKRVNP
jgi:hypothetical protein